MTIDIETYLNSLSEDILVFNIHSKNIDYIPDLTRFKNLEVLYCDNNELTSLPNLPENLIELYCGNNQLTSLHTLPKNLEVLYCSDNQLTSLPTLPQNLKKLYCSDNQLTCLPTLPQNLKYLYFRDNPIYEIVNRYDLLETIKNIQILNNFCYLYYCLKYKKQFRKWLWEKVREAKIQQIYHPNYLIENLKEEDDLDIVLNNWK